jgi:hypothetical protein
MQLDSRAGVLEAVFIATAVPALGSLVFGVALSATSGARTASVAPDVAAGLDSRAPVVLSNDAISAAFDGSSGLLLSIVSRLRLLHPMFACILLHLYLMRRLQWGAAR